ncbi:hypothetical protein [Catellatospora citrea]|uniref:Uncharacterized protein n=2 Tax=Catellatospora citrea TaxID=53366 RepID=A0A8J3K7T6_9ACTN|nr:hypothetical protein [Catellatospora citrea]RKE07557.1 hypothetical protein C8E86_2385 [Catellatospora citrea]GIF95714.1 hypothetical protein Cci01nite_08080 [Catellatospora citrea]
MQMKKAGAVATGALATVAIMGAPAAAAPSTDASALTQASTSTEGKTSSMRQVGANQLKLARGGGFDNNGWDAPWDIDSASVVALLNGTVVNVAALQQCGSTSGNVVGISVPITSPNTVVSGFGHDDGYGHKNDIACANANVKIKQTDKRAAILGVGNDSAVNIASIQSCGSTDGQVVGITVPITSPNTVIGDCQNSNIEINGADEWDDNDHWQESGRVEAMPMGQSVAMDMARQALVKKVSALKNRSAWAKRGANARVAPQARGGGWDAPWDQDSVSLISALNGTAVQLITTQACGSTSPDVISLAIPITSPNTVIGDCKNANVKISKDDPKGVISALDNTSLNVLPLQSCGSTSANIIAAAVPITSPNTVIGSCYNANTVID